VGFSFPFLEGQRAFQLEGMSREEGSQAEKGTKGLNGGGHVTGVEGKEEGKVTKSSENGSFVLGGWPGEDRNLVGLTLGLGEAFQGGRCRGL